MIVLSLGRWNHAAGRWFIRERIWFRGYIWTPFCRIERRWKNMKDRLFVARTEYQKLQELAIWMTGCGYDFTQHDYFVRERHLLSAGPMPPAGAAHPPWVATRGGEGQ